jgi:serine/threonine protein kinase
MLNSKIKDYHIQSELGRGGMATVFLAHDNKFDTNVAVKVLNKEFVHNENIRKRFIAEARNLFKMSHPNIIKVTDLIDDGETVAFVMEYIDGETLKDYIDRKGKLSDGEIKSLFSQMLDAVGYVHEQNLVHRDIKPSNFMIDHKGKVKLMDFGIAKNTDSTSAEYTQTVTGMQMGTPMYMSPEQITETKSVTAQSDIYSLGVVLWQMVTGEKPYDVKTLSSFQLQLKIVNDTLDLTRTKWDTTISKATQKEINSRFFSCSDFLFNLTSNYPIKSYDDSISNAELEKTLIEENQSNNLKNELIKCPRCLAKGYVDLDDIVRLGNEEFWLPGPCALCDQSGKITRDNLDLVDDIFLAYNEKEVEEYFSHLVGKEKVFLSSDLPSKKIQNFITNFNEEFFDEGDILVYYDDTIWGKGDNGFMIYKQNEY